MLRRLAPVAAANARAEAVELAADAGHPIEAWDWAFYAERVRASRYDVDAAALRPYFELERVLHDGVFFAASQLYGLSFAERHDLPALPPRRARLRGARRRRPARPVPRRPLHPRLQARRRLDEPLRRPVPPARHAAGRGQQPQHRQAPPTASRRC